MTTIAIIISPTTVTTRVVAALRHVEPDISMLELRSRINRGVPVLEYSLYGNGHVEVATQLRTLVREIPAAGGELHLFLLVERETFEQVSAAREIPVATLLNMLDEAEGEFE